MNESNPTLLPLTTAQRGLWVGHKIGGEDAVMNIAEAIEICGPVVPELFQRALWQITREAETTRVSISEHEGLPRQTIRAEYNGDFPYIDFSQEADPYAAADRWMMAEIKKPVDFANDPLWVGALIKLADDRFYWYHRAHHTVYDGYSGGLIARRLAELYTAYVEDREPAPCEFGTLQSLLEAEAAYRDSDRYHRDRAYWKEQLADIPEATTLAHRRVRNPGGLRRSSAHVTPEQKQRLLQIAKDNGVSLPQVLIALIASYYYRATGANDLVFGMPVTGRVNHALRSTPGMVANAVTIRLSLTPETTMPELFQQVSRVVRSALRHQQYRFEDLRRDMGLLNPNQHIAWLGVNIEPFDYVHFAGQPAIGHNMYNGSAEDLTIFVYDRSEDQGLRFDLDANPTLYPEDQLNEHRRRLLNVVDHVLAEPSVALSALNVLGAEEHGRLVHDWNDTAAELPDTTPLSLFQQQAVLTPEAPALQFGATTLSYRELNERSSRQAMQLIEHGVAPGDLVAVALPRSEDLPITLLAIWKAGAAYLPLDPEAPLERTLLTLGDAAPSAVVTAPHLASHFQGRVPRVLYPLTDESVVQLRPLPGPDDAESLAYAIYTSGSTGVPKGVEVTHRNLCNFLLAMQRQLKPEANQRYLAQTTISFDIAGLELFLPLTVGATVVLITADVVRNPPALARLIRDQRIDVMQATPSLWRILLASPDTRLEGIHALVGGEALPPELAQRLTQLADKVTNLYGPTETTVWSTAMELTVADTATGTAPSIGRPILNTQVYVLDAALNPMPTGCIGELYIAGEGVARGYRHRPELNAERFLRDPFRSEPNARMYRTGDLARWREDGTLDFLGRADQQVKIRGFRVELGEIETQLVLHPSVAEAAVKLHQDSQGNASLIGYLVPVDNAVFEADTIRNHLLTKLPDYMVPAHLMVLPELPLTPNGKLDRKALPAPDRSLLVGYAPPTTEIERKLVVLWQEIFNRERVGIHDNFFELGGDSLTAAELLASFPRHFDRELPLGSLFEASTIAGLAKYLERSDGTTDPLGGLLSLRVAAEERPLFCIHPVTGFSWAYASLLRHLDDALPVYALQSRGLRGGALPASIEEIAADYTAQMRRIQPHGPYRVLGWSLGGLIGHAIASQLEAQGERLEFLAMMDSYPFVSESADIQQDEGKQAQAVLKFLGFHQRAGENPPQSMHDLADLLCREYDVFSIPLVQEITKTDVKLIEHVSAVTRNNLNLARKYRPGHVDVDIVFFNAKVKESVDLDGILHYHAAAWKPYVNGKVEIHDIDCHHQAMLEPRAAAQIARVLRQRLVPRYTAEPRDVAYA